MALVVYFSIFFFDIELPEEIKGHNSVDIYYNTQQHHGQYKLKYINNHRYLHIELPEEIKGHNSVDIYYNTQQHHG